MDQTKKEEDVTAGSKKNFETFDLWSKAQFAMWSNIRYDFELVAELTRYRKSTRKCLELLDTVNHYLKNKTEKIFFDGTIRCLKFLVKNNYLVLSDLPTLTQDEKYLVELLDKYAKRLDFMEVIADIEEPTLRAMLLEYPNLMDEILKDPLGGHFIGKALLKNGVTDADSLVEKVDNGLNSIEVDKDKYSKEAMKCKLIYLGLRLNNGKLKIMSSATGIITLFETLTDESIENETYTKGMVNAMYASFYGSDEWGDNRKTHLSGCETLYLDFQLLFLPDNHMSLIYDLFLKKEVDKIGEKYFGEEYKPEGFIASLAIKMAVMIILFRTENFIPKGEKEGVSFFTKGAMLGGLNYGVEEGDEKEPLKLKKWFLDYFIKELDKRVAFIKMQVDNDVAVVDMGRIRVIYLPVFESFRFFCSKGGLLEGIITLLKNKKIPNSVKDDIFINFATNIQKIIAEPRSTDEENYFKDTFTLLIIKTFEGLVKNVSLRLKDESKKFYEMDDLIGDSTVSVIELIKDFDITKSDSFIGYLSKNLLFKVKSSSRPNKADDNTVTENTMEEDFLSGIPDAENFITSLEDKEAMTKIRQYMENLPEKQKEAIKKTLTDNEGLTETDRRNKNRGF